MFPWLIIVVIIKLVTVSESWMSYTVLFEKANFKTNPEYIDINHTISENRRFITVSVNVVKPIDHFQLDFVLKANVGTTNTKNESQWNDVVHRTVNYCDYIKMNPIPDVMLNIMYEELRSKSNGFMTSCPVPIGRFNVSNYEVDASRLPPYMPNCQFFCKLVVYSNTTSRSKSVPLYEFTTVGSINNDLSWKRFKTLNKKH